MDPSGHLAFAPGRYALTGPKAAAKPGQWSVSTRTLGEVLATAVHTDQLRILLFSNPSGSLAPELEERLDGLFHKRRKRGEPAPTGPRAIPAPLQLATLGLIGLVRELNDLDGSPAGAIAFYGAAEEVGCAYVGGNNAEVWSRGAAFHAPWMTMRGPAPGSNGVPLRARVFSLILTADLDLKLQWPFLIDAQGESGVMVDAAWEPPAGINVSLRATGGEVNRGVISFEDFSKIEDVVPGVVVPLVAPAATTVEEVAMSVADVVATVEAVASLDTAANSDVVATAIDVAPTEEVLATVEAADAPALVEAPATESLSESSVETVEPQVVIEPLAIDTTREFTMEEYLAMSDEMLEALTAPRAVATPAPTTVASPDVEWIAPVVEPAVEAMSEVASEAIVEAPVEATLEVSAEPQMAPAPESAIESPIEWWTHPVVESAIEAPALAAPESVTEAPLAWWTHPIVETPSEVTEPVEAGTAIYLDMAVDAPAEAFGEVILDMAIEMPSEIVVESSIESSFGSTIESVVDAQGEAQAETVLEPAGETAVAVPPEDIIEPAFEDALEALAEPVFESELDAWMEAWTQLEPTARTEAPAEPVLERTVESLIEAATEPVIEAPFETPVEAPAEVQLEAETQAPIEAVLEAAPEAPVESHSEFVPDTSTEAPTEAVVEAVVETPVEALLESSTEPFVESPPEIEAEAPNEPAAEPVVETPAEAWSERVFAAPFEAKIYPFPGTFNEPAFASTPEVPEFATAAAAATAATAATAAIGATPTPVAAEVSQVVEIAHTSAAPSVTAPRALPKVPGKLKLPKWATLQLSPQVGRVLLGCGACAVLVIGVVSLNAWVGGESTYSGPTPITTLLRGLGILPPCYTVLVKSDPPGAFVAVDGHAVKQKTPAELEISQGHHDLLLSLPELGQWATPVDGQRDDYVAIEAKLTGTLRVVAEAPSTLISVAVDGEPRGLLPVRLSGLLPGLHEVRYSMPGQLAWSQIVRVPICGDVVVKARPSSRTVGGSIGPQPVAPERELDLPSKGAATSLNDAGNTPAPQQVTHSRGAVEIATPVPVPTMAERAAFPRAGEIWFELSSSNGARTPVAMEAKTMVTSRAEENSRAEVKPAAQQREAVRPHTAPARRAHRVANAVPVRKVPVYVLKRPGAKSQEATGAPACADEHHESASVSRSDS